MKLSEEAIKAIDLAATKWVTAALRDWALPSDQGRTARAAAWVGFLDLLHSDLPEDRPRAGWSFIAVQ